MGQTSAAATHHDPLANLPTQPTQAPPPKKAAGRRKKVNHQAADKQPQSLKTPIGPARVQSKAPVSSPESKPSPVIKKQAQSKILHLIVFLGSLAAIGIGIAGLGSKVNFWQAGALSQLPTPASIGFLGGGILALAGFEFIAYACRKKAS